MSAGRRPSYDIEMGAADSSTPIYILDADFGQADFWDRHPECREASLYINEQGSRRFQTHVSRPAGGKR